MPHNCNLSFLDRFQSQTLHITRSTLKFEWQLIWQQPKCMYEFADQARINHGAYNK